MERDDGSFSREVKEQILKRADFRCDRCGLRTDEGGQFHHRNPRRAGGTRRPEVGLPSNGLLLHPSCHDYIEKHRIVAAGLGFIVGYGTLPKDAPVMLWSGWHTLNDDGTATRLPGVPPLQPSADEPPETPDR